MFVSSINSWNHCCKRIKRSTHLHQAQCSRDKRHLFPCIREKSASKSANMPLSLNARLQNSSRSSLVSVLILIVALTKHFLPYRNNNDSWLSFRAALKKLNLNMRDKNESLTIHYFRSNVQSLINFKTTWFSLFYYKRLKIDNRTRDQRLDRSRLI